MKGSGDFSIGSQVWPGACKLIEEMGELQQVLGKLIGTAGGVKDWDGKFLDACLKEELADLKAAIEFFQMKNFDSATDKYINRRTEVKLQLFLEWHKNPEAPK